MLTICVLFLRLGTVYWVYIYFILSLIFFFLFFFSHGYEYGHLCSKWAFWIHACSALTMILFDRDCCSLALLFC